MITLHPGTYINKVYVEPNIYSISRIALTLGVPCAVVEPLIEEQTDLTADLAVRLPVVFDGSAEFWMAMQSQHNLRIARTALAPGVVTKLELPPTPR